jgi:hypothetical protein
MIVPNIIIKNRQQKPLSFILVLGLFPCPARVSPRKKFNDLVEYSDMRNRGGVIERLKNFNHGDADLGVGALREWVPVIKML